MSIGERRHRVTFQRAHNRRDAFGEADKSYTDICTSWAMVQPLKGTERFAANLMQFDVDHRIVTRARTELTDLSPGDRAIWNGKTYDIRSVIWRDHRASELEILAQQHF